MDARVAAAVLGVVQGITEFLPVSSSGHLVLFQSVLPVAGDPVAFDVALHLGSLVPVFAVYGRDVVRLARDALGGPGPVAARRGVRAGLAVLAASVPTAAAGLLLEERFEALFSSPRAVGVALAITGAVLWSTRRLSGGGRDEADIGLGRALLVGAAQAFAITPGISRSGSTIAAGLLLGMERDAAARFSFLLFLPAVAGAALLRARTVEWTPEVLAPMAVGFLAAALAGAAALVVLLRVVRAGRLSAFSWYLWAVAALALALG